MATPLSAARFLAALKAEGVNVVEVGDWRDHNRNHVGPWGPVHGVMIHHTVTKGAANTVDICRKGYSGLPGPLCHGVITKDGRVHLVGYGRANHAGSGDDDVLRAVIGETALPTDNEQNTDGNRYFYGFECENLGDGEDPWPAAQLLAIERAAAALCRYHGWDQSSVIGHLEWQPGKVDPRGFTMASMRARIAKRLGAQPPASGGSASGATYTVRQGDTLWSIARAHGTTVPALVDMNGLRDPTHIDVGQKLKLPGAAVVTYTVARGDTLWSIATSRLGDGDRWREIASLNSLRDADEITPGQKLKLPKK
ncbi:LysM peptidoglycan-binding domain-containing protein [Streptomyces cinereospinus]|uniref:LysM peptidoglycan-binding domain-containing protein n=1 Tax=Streptomyces cinereospinus TaxID=285561 RepID=A0ABV5N2P3_9ACTN